MSIPNQRRIIIINRGRKHAGHHGSSAWKIAYADFVTAMMAFFLLLWLISSANKATLAGLSEYFTEATITARPKDGNLAQQAGASGKPDFLRRSPMGPLSERPMPPPDRPENRDASDYMALADGQAQQLSDQALRDELMQRESLDFKDAQAAILDAVQSSPELAGLAENLIFAQTPEGLRIEIVDRDKLAMFPLGSDTMYPHTAKLLAVVATAVARLPNKLSIRGHTDDLPYGPGAVYDNWRLSSDRANATRIALGQAGLPVARIADVVGKADAEPLAGTATSDPRNRRLSIVLLHAAARPETPGRD